MTSGRSHVLAADGLEYLISLHEKITSSTFNFRPFLTAFIIFPFFKEGRGVEDMLLDVLMIDVDSKDGITSGITAPPLAFISLHQLSIMHSLLDSNGLLVINVASRKPSFLQDVIAVTKKVFCTVTDMDVEQGGHVYTLRPSEDTLNTVLIASKSSASSEEGRPKLLQKWLQVESLLMIN